MNQIKKKRHLPLSGVIGLFSTITLLLSVISIFSIDFRLLELFSHFRVHYLLGSIVFFCAYLYANHHRLTFILGVCVTINAYYVLPWYVPLKLEKAVVSNLNTSKPSPLKKQLKLFHINLLSSNKEYDKLLYAIENEQPDIIIVQEVSFSWNEQLKNLYSDYGFYKIIPRQDNFGIGILSKVPLTKIQEIDWGNSGGLPGLLVHFKLNETTIQLATLHTLPPINKIYYGQRNKSLKAVVSELRNSSIPTLLIGDFNISMWSPNYSIFESYSEIYNARRGFGINATWPADLGVLGIPIDHIFVSQHFTVKEFYTGTNVGSDHLPLVAHINLN